MTLRPLMTGVTHRNAAVAYRGGKFSDARDFSMATAEERRFIDDGGWISSTARECTNARWEEYGFEGGPYLGFPKSHDVYGDGSIVVVPQPGHTPGS